MIFSKKKVTQIFSNGSLNFDNTFIKKSNKVKVNKKDHITFLLNKKNLTLLTSSKDFESFKTRYLKFNK